MAKKKIYTDPNRSVENRVKDLLGRMTLPEKIGQMMQLPARGNLDAIIREKHVGSILHVAPDVLPRAIEMAAETRLGIPLLIADDCIHGHSFWKGATIFPTQLAMACSWEPALLERVGRITALEVTATGFKWTFSPVLCLARDLRWGRIGETFGEDPFLIGEFASALVRGYQGRGLDDPTAILATAKHFAGYSETQGGRDASEADISRRKLRSYFLPPFERAAREGCMAFMTGYQSMDGIPTTANRWLLKEVLKEEWDWKGILVTDWDNVGRLVKEQKICADLAEAAAVAVRSGNDMIMTTPGFFDGARQAVEKGLLAESEIDEVVSRILALKFRMGLFENPGRPDKARQKKLIGCAEHTAFNREVARRSLVVLKNDGLLPLAAKPGKTIAVIGPNADDPDAQLGDWAGRSGQVEWMKDGHPRETITTVLDGIRAHAPKGWKVKSAQGGAITVQRREKGADGEWRPKKWTVAEPDKAALAKAVKTAQAADVVVAVVGDAISLVGECRSTATLELQAGQRELLEKLAACGKPMVVVLIASKPMVLPPAALQAGAIVCQFNPGMAGGHALAEALFGAFNPSGRLTISFPRHVGQQPIYYSQVRGQHGSRYADLDQEPLFAFGEGLSYTTFAYDNLRALTPEVKRNDRVRVSVDVRNTGAREGRETVQFYVSDLVTSATWVQKELKAYRQVVLQPGESRTVEFALPAQALTIVNAAGERVVEPGEFEALVGPNSRDRNLLRARFRVVR